MEADAADGGAGAQAEAPVLPDPVPRGGERALARGLPGEGAQPVFTPGTRYPLAGLLLALPAVEATGLLGAARQVYSRLRNGLRGLTATLLTLVFLALPSLSPLPPPPAAKSIAAAETPPAGGAHAGPQTVGAGFEGGRWPFKSPRCLR